MKIYKRCEFNYPKEPSYTHALERAFAYIVKHLDYRLYYL